MIIDRAKRVIGLLEKKSYKNIDVVVSDLIAAPYHKKSGGEIIYLPTSTQLIIISRYLDIEKRKKGQDYYWVYKNNDEKEMAKKEFDSIICSLDEYGIINCISNFDIVRRPIISINHGTHRLGYVLTMNKASWVQCNILPSYRENWFPIDGVDYFQSKGYNDSEIHDLITSYKDIYKRIYHHYIAVVSLPRSIEFEELIKEYGKIEKCEELCCTEKNKHKEGHQSKKYRIIYNCESAKVYKIEIDSQILRWRRGEMISIVSESIQKQMEMQGKNWGYISRSFSDAILFEIMLKEQFGIGL